MLSWPKEWAIHDLRERRATITKILDGASADLTAEVRQLLQAEAASVEEAIRSYGGLDASLSKRAASRAGEGIPSVEGMAHELGLRGAYSIAYRVMSQTDVHATALAVDAVFEDEPRPSDPGRRLREAPRRALPNLDLYAAGARLLVDILEPLVNQMPELGWAEMLTEFSDRLKRAEQEGQSGSP
jgi:hypothetical protein